MTHKEAFGALCEALEYDIEFLTPSASKLIGKVAAELVKAKATEESILYLPTAWQRMWGQGELPTLTVTAVATHWPALWKLYQSHLRARESRLAAEAATASPGMAREEREGGVCYLDIEENRRRWHELMAKFGGSKNLVRVL